MEYYSPDTEFIMKYIKELKLPTVKDSIDDIITDATAGQWDYRNTSSKYIHRMTNISTEHQVLTGERQLIHRKKGKILGRYIGHCIR